jgi:hypothetical protein
MMQGTGKNISGKGQGRENDQGEKQGPGGEQGRTFREREGRKINSQFPTLIQIGDVLKSTK